ncbi:SpoIIE family protein phosphatase [Streptomyces sp. NPDC002057]|uniref:SpoIIE family protein phosphatase n=1 Tax=Streptomyces sp. NPDC002057 TaxID=3154664 RepID=UPI00331E9FE2
MAGFALGVLAPTLHNATLIWASADLDMDGRARAWAQVLVVGASLAGLFWAGRAADVHGTRRVVLWSLFGSCVGGALLVSATTMWWYWTGLVVESASIMGAVAGYVASMPVLHLTGRLYRIVSLSFAALAVALVVGVALTVVAEVMGGWRAAEAVPLVVSACLLVAAFRLLPMTLPPADAPPPLPVFRTGSVVVVVLGCALQATPLRSWLDIAVVALLAVSLGALALSCGQAQPLRLPRFRRGGGLDPQAADAVVGPVVLAGGVWGFGQSALATVLLVLLSERGGGPGGSLVAWAGFGVGFAAAGLYAAWRAPAARSASALGLTLAAVSTALLYFLPSGRSWAAAVLAALLSAVVGFGVVVTQVPWATRFLAGLPVDGRGAGATAYPAAVILGGAAVSGFPYESAISEAARAETVHQLLWITVTVFALAAVWLGRSAVAIAVAGAAGAQYLLFTTLSDDSYAQRPLSMSAFVVTGVIVGLAVWARGRQTERLISALADAAALQQAVLRPLPARVGDLEVSGLYRPATAGTGVGGDFYDIAHTPFGTRVLIGDVCGKGLQAVQTVADVLGCFRSQAHETPGLTELTARLDRHLARAALARQDGELFATALLIEHPETSPHLYVINCGHPPPVVIGPDHQVREVELPSLLPLGLGLLDQDTLPAPMPVRLPAGTLLLLHTDGLSEARDASGTFYPLAERLLHLPADHPRPLITHLLADLEQWTHHLTDDIALIALTPAPPGPAVTPHLPPPSQPAPPR